MRMKKSITRLKKRDGARRRRFRREEEREKKEINGEDLTSESVEKVAEGIIPDSELKTWIRRGLYHSKSLPSFPSFSPLSSAPIKFHKTPNFNPSSSRKRSIQRATPVSSPPAKEQEVEQESETEESSAITPSRKSTAEQFELEPEGHK